jgi:uncharacterized membrane protein YjfL (UPF0719 family)
MEPLTTQLLGAGSLILICLLVLAFAKFVNDLITPYVVDIELAQRDNTALAVSFSGYMMAVMIVFIGALIGPSSGIGLDLLNVGSYSVGGIVLLNLARFINDKCILYKFSNFKEIIEDRNVGTGAVQFGSYIASGLIVAGAIQGEGGGFLSVLALFAAGQVVLVIFTLIYNLVTPFDIHDEIEKDNAAVGVAFGGALIAIGIVLMNASAGNFAGWGIHLSSFVLHSLVVLLLLPIVRFCFDKFLFARFDLNREIQEDRNLGAGFLEATAMIGFATALVVIVS